MDHSVSTFRSMPTKPHFHPFYILFSSQIKSNYRERDLLRQTRAVFMRSIVDECIEDALGYCLRNDNYHTAYAGRRSAISDSSPSLSHIMDLNTLVSGARISADYGRPSADAHASSLKTLSSRFFGFSGAGSPAIISSVPTSTSIGVAASDLQQNMDGNGNKPSNNRNSTSKSSTTFVGRFLGSNSSK